MVLAVYIDEYVPTTIPMIRAVENPRTASPPIKNSANNTSKVVKLVAALMVKQRPLSRIPF